jgi:hypothetical protein
VVLPPASKYLWYWDFWSGSLSRNWNYTKSDRNTDNRE